MTKCPNCLQTTDACERSGCGQRRRVPASPKVVVVTADTITDEQIRALWSGAPNAITGRDLMDALGEVYGPCMRKPTDEETQSARARCADAWNARSGAKS